MTTKAVTTWIVLTLAIAFGTCTIATLYAPTFIMNKAMSKLSQGQQSNSIAHSDPTTAEQRTIVRPSPDLAYSICIFDFSSAERVRIVMPKADDYLSVALYDNNTDNFFHLNDAQIIADQASIILYPPQVGIPSQASSNVDRYSLNAPTTRGLVLFRSVVRSSDDWQRINADRKLMSCSALQ